MGRDRQRVGLYHDDLAYCAVNVDKVVVVFVHGSSANPMKSEGQ